MREPLKLGFNTYCFATERLVWGLPDTSLALLEPNGLLASGGQVEPETLVYAYRRGVFPWYSEGQPVLWWSPEPRCVLWPAALRISRSLGKRLRREEFDVTFDQAFTAVMDACAEDRADADGTWITNDIRAGYRGLHQLGYAHSVECWFEGQLAGGLYGVSIGRVFFGESMFTRRTDASKVALATLCANLVAWQYEMVDCQVHTPHLESLGAEMIPRTRFNSLLREWSDTPPAPGAWQAPWVSP